MASIALANFIDVRDKLDALADDEEDDNDDEDPDHAGLLHKYFIFMRNIEQNLVITFLVAWRLLGWFLEDFLVLKDYH